MSIRRRLMIQGKTEPIVWDYEWYPPEEKPSWFTITNTNVSYEMGDTYFRIYCANNPGNQVERQFFTFLASEFPNTKSYLVEIDMTDMAARQATSGQGGICYSKLTGTNNSIWVKRNGNSKIPGTNYYQVILASGPNDYNGPVITNNLRYKIRLFYDNTNGLFKASVGDKEFSIAATGIAPRQVWSRYVNNRYIDIHSVKIKVIENE